MSSKQTGQQDYASISIEHDRNAITFKSDSTLSDWNNEPTLPDVAQMERLAEHLLVEFLATDALALMDAHPEIETFAEAREAVRKGWLR